MAGHIKRASDQAEKPVDYNDGEFSNHFCSEFHHIIGSPPIYTVRWRTQCIPPPHFFYRNNNKEKLIYVLRNC